MALALVNQVLARPTLPRQVRCSRYCGWCFAESLLCYCTTILCIAAVLVETHFCARVLYCMARLLASCFIVACTSSGPYERYCCNFRYNYLGLLASVPQELVASLEQKPGALTQVGLEFYAPGTGSVGSCAHVVTGLKRETLPSCL